MPGKALQQTRSIIVMMILMPLLFSQSARAANSSIAGYDAAGDAVRSTDGTLISDRSTTITVNNAASGGAFVVNDAQNGGGTVALINGTAATTTLGSTAVAVTHNETVGGTLGVTGVSTLSGINNQNDGITNAGSISGATTISAGNGTTSNGAINVSSSTVANTITLTGSTGTIQAGVNGQAGSVDVANASGSNTFAVAGSTGTVTVGNGSTTAGSINLDSTVSANTISLAGASGRGTFGNLGNAGGVQVTNASGVDAVELEGSGSSVIANGVSLYSGGTAVSGSGSSVLVNGTSAQLNSADSGSNLTVDNGTASLKVTNASTGVQHGIDIGQTSTVLSGGTHSTSLTLDDNGATFANGQSGGASQVHGVADGTTHYDAVNLGQLQSVGNRAYAGVASAIAMANIPSPAPGKNYAIGAAYGNYSDQDAVAIGVKAIVGQARNITLSVDYAYAGTISSVGAGVSYSF